MKKVVNIITTIALLIVWAAVVVGFVREDSIFDDPFLVFLAAFALAMTLEKVVNFFDRKK